MEGFSTNMRTKHPMACHGMTQFMEVEIFGYSESRAGPWDTNPSGSWKFRKDMGRRKAEQPAGVRGGEIQGLPLCLTNKDTQGSDLLGRAVVVIMAWHCLGLS